MIDGPLTRSLENERENTTTKPLAERRQRERYTESKGACEQQQRCELQAASRQQQEKQEELLLLLTRYLPANQACPEQNTTDDTRR